MGWIVRADRSQSVQLADQFATATVEVKKPYVLCAPANKNGSLICHPSTHQYASLGVSHILMGWDHLLFVLGLVLLVRGRKRLVKTVTAFTLGHSVTSLRPLRCQTSGEFLPTIRRAGRPPVSRYYPPSNKALRGRE